MTTGFCPGHLGGCFAFTEIRSRGLVGEIMSLVWGTGFEDSRKRSHILYQRSFYSSTPLSTPRGSFGQFAPFILVLVQIPCCQRAFSDLINLHHLTLPCLPIPCVDLPTSSELLRQALLFTTVLPASEIGCTVSIC